MTDTNACLYPIRDERPAEQRTACGYAHIAPSTVEEHTPRDEAKP